MELYAQVLVNRMLHCKFLHRAPFTESDAVHGTRCGTREQNQNQSEQRLGAEPGIRQFSTAQPH